MVDGMDEYLMFEKLHGEQLRLSNVPELLWHTLFCKLKNEVFDAGEVFMLAYDEEENYTVVLKDDIFIKPDDIRHIYLIDHAWTFQAREAISQLRAVPGLLERMSSLMSVSSDLSDDAKIEQVCSLMWKFARTYSRTIAADEPPETFWYVMDEFGCYIHHSNNPNFRVIPFYCHLQEMTYTLLFPITDVKENEMVCVDYVEGSVAVNIRAREALLVPWTQQSFIEEPPEHASANEEYFLLGAEREKLPLHPISMPRISNVLKVYTEYPFVREYLKHPDFVITDSEDDADILWLTRHFYDYKTIAEATPGTFINQFPSERVITTKDLLSIVCLRDSESDWFPETYNLITELPNFVGVFQRREVDGLDNHWICKPWNLARAIDTTVSNNLNHILRLPFTGPKIAQKYVDNQVLFNRLDVGWVKFDVRYVVLLESVQPLKLYCYKDFFLRFANKPFDLSDLWDYEKHFTVMNYRNNSNLHELTSEDFKVEFRVQNPNHSWVDIERCILQSLKKVFTAASTKPPPCGLGHCPQSRALYAADFVLSWKNDKIQPLLLEINFAPDCERACRYYPSFYDDIFSLLFKGNVDDEKFFVL